MKAYNNTVLNTSRHNPTTTSADKTGPQPQCPAQCSTTRPRVKRRGSSMGGPTVIQQDPTSSQHVDKHWTRG